MKIRNILLLAALTATVLTGCTNDKEETPARDLADTPIRIRAGILDRSLTRAGYESDESLQGSDFGLFLTTTGDATGDPRYNATNMRFSYEAGAWAAVIDEGKGETQLLWKNNSAQVSYCAYLPYNGQEDAITDGIYTFTLPTEQDTEEALKAADLLYATGTAAASGDGAIDIAFSHMLSRLTISLTQGTELEGTDIAFQSVTLNNCCLTSIGINLNPGASAGAEAGSGESTGSPSETTSGTGSVTLYRPDPAAAVFQGILIPQSQPLSVLIKATVTKEGIPEEKFYRYTSATALTLASGTSYELELKVGRDKVTAGNVSVAGWDETGWGKPEEGTAEEVTPVDAERHSITLLKAGGLTTADVEKAVGTGNTLTITGLMNSGDLAAVKAYLTSYAGTDFRLDLSGVTELTEIPDNAFKECTGLASMKLSDNITRIGAGAFSGCTNLTTVNMPQNLISMGAGAFYESGLSGEIELPEGFTTFDPFNANNPGMQFDGTKITALTLPESLGDITVNTIRCYNCDKLKTVTFKSTVKELFYDAFAGSPNLTDVYMLGNATEAPIFPEYLFDDKTKVTIHVPQGASSYFSDLTSAGYIVVEITE